MKIKNRLLGYTGILLQAHLLALGLGQVVTVQAAAFQSAVYVLDSKESLSSALHYAADNLEGNPSCFSRSMTSEMDFVVPNELQLESALAFFENTPVTGAYAGVGTLRTFMTAAMMQPATAIIPVDYCPCVFAYNAIFVFLMQASDNREALRYWHLEAPFEDWEAAADQLGLSVSRADLSTLYAFWMNRLRTPYVEASSIIEDHKPLNDAIVWAHFYDAASSISPFSNDAIYSRLKSLITRGKVALVREDLNSPSAIASLRAALKALNERLGLLDLSNAFEIFRYCERLFFSYEYTFPHAMARLFLGLKSHTRSDAYLLDTNANSSVRLGSDDQLLEARLDPSHEQSFHHLRHNLTIADIKAGSGLKGGLNEYNVILMQELLPNDTAAFEASLSPCQKQGDKDPSLFCYEDDLQLADCYEDDCFYECEYNRLYKGWVQQSTPDWVPQCANLEIIAVQ